MALYNARVPTQQVPINESRRSTRVPLDVSIEVLGEAGAIKGVTVVVNLHGALVRVVRPMQLHSRIMVSVHLTGKSAAGRVVYLAPDNPLTCGIELERPQNIWGVSFAHAPDDWRENFGLAATES